MSKRPPGQYAHTFIRHRLAAELLDSCVELLSYTPLRCLLRGMARCLRYLAFSRGEWFLKALEPLVEDDRKRYREASLLLEASWRACLRLEHVSGDEPGKTEGLARALQALAVATVALKELDASTRTRRVS